MKDSTKKIGLLAGAGEVPAHFAIRAAQKGICIVAVSFSDEIHKFLGNRPKMYPGFIGGHCVIPNLELINDEQFWQIDKLNNIYLKKVKNAKSIAKKYVKGKQSYTSNP